MPSYTLKDFWIPRLRIAERQPSASLVKGWSFIDKVPNTFFKEAPIAPSSDLGSNHTPETSPVILVSAAGAVGKSTLARQIAYETGSIYLDLATADPVGANTLSGGLARSGLYNSWASGDVAILLDGLDEARIRVTQEAFESFLSDVAHLSAGRAVPTVLLGRTGAIQEAWLILTVNENTDNISVFEIGYYGAEESVEFAEATLRVAKPDSPHQTVERQCLELLLREIRNQTDSDGDRFAGYAPVLQAVAKRVEQEGNPAALVSQIEGGGQPVTLNNVAAAILEREQGKLSNYQFEDPDLGKSLYSPTEQLDRLVALVYNLPPPALPEMSVADTRTYSNLLDSWVGEHPFWDASRNSPSSAVFDALISTQALRSHLSAVSALQRELRRGASVNPFLSEFYFSERFSSIPLEHIGVVYASLRSRLSLGDTASLTVAGSEDEDEEAALLAEVEITYSRPGSDAPRNLRLATEQVGTLYLGSHLEDVDVFLPDTRVEIGPGSEAVLVAPVNIQCKDLSIITDKVIVEKPSDQEVAVFLEADHFSGTQIASLPVIRDGNVELGVCWPGSTAYPWSNFSVEPTIPEDPRLDEALRRFRKFVIEFRSHSNHGLARFSGKINHARMTKGTGQAVLDLMVEEGILDRRQTRYFLNIDRLSELTGATYVDCAMRRFSDKAIAFVQKALE